MPVLSAGHVMLRTASPADVGMFSFFFMHCPVSQRNALSIAAAVALDSVAACNHQQLMCQTLQGLALRSWPPWQPTPCARLCWCGSRPSRPRRKPSRGCWLREQLCGPL